MKKILPILLVSLINGVLFAQEPSQTQKALESVEKKLDVCLAKDMSTAGMIQCSDVAYKQYDSLLNWVYTRLKSSLSQERRKMLISNQKLWIRLRDKDFRFMDTMQPEGTMWGPVFVGHKAKYLRSRIEELNFLEEISQGD